MTRRSTFLITLLTLGILLVGMGAVFGAEAAVPADNFYRFPPPLRLDSEGFQAQEAALPLIRNGCLEVMVVASPNAESDIKMHATCMEWQEIRPALQ